MGLCVTDWHVYSETQQVLGILPDLHARLGWCKAVMAIARSG